MPDDAALVTAFLADRHVACPACGYDLHGISSAVCPECGDRPSLQLDTSEVMWRRVGKGLRLVAWGMIAAGVTWIARTAFAWLTWTTYTGGTWRGWLFTFGWFGYLMVASQLTVGVWMLVRLRRVKPRAARPVAVARSAIVLTAWLSLYFASQVLVAVFYFLAT